VGRPLIGRLAIFDGLDFEWREVQIRRDPECPVCGDNPTVRGLIDYDEFCGIPRSQEKPMTGVPEMTVTELKERLDRGERLELVDVREDYEWQIGNLEPYGAKLIPMGQLKARLDEIERGGEVVMICRTGSRSRRAVQMLEQAGFTGVWNLAGGMNAWSEEIDPKIPQY
jgi:adenylyltransferase/sulfurtransferase